MNSDTNYEPSRGRKKKIRRDCVHIRVYGEKAVCDLFEGVADCEYCSAYYRKSQNTKQASEKNIETEIDIAMENRDIINAHTPADFEPVILGDGELRVYVSQSNGVTFTKGVVKSLNNPEYIEISVNKAGRQLAVRACVANEKSAIRCKMNSAGGYRLKRCELITIVAEAMGIDVLRGAYRASGYLREGDGVLIFEFSRAVKLKRGGAKSHGEEK